MFWNHYNDFASLHVLRSHICFLTDNIQVRVFHPIASLPLQWRHSGRDGVSNHQPHDCLLNRLFMCRSKKTSKLHVTSLCEGNSGTGEFPAQMASYAENISIWWRHHGSEVLGYERQRYHFTCLSLCKVFEHPCTYIIDIMCRRFISVVTHVRYKNPMYRNAVNPVGNSL